MKSLETKRRYYKRKKAKIWKRIQKIAQEENVPTWKARLYFYYKKETADFLYFREVRRLKNFKSEVGHYLDENSENNSIDTIDWRELYEILGEEATSKLSITYMLKIIEVILRKIKCLATVNEVIPYEFEEEVLSECYMKEETFSVIQDSIKRYLLTELPIGSEICLELFKKIERGPQEVIYIGGGCTHQYANEYNQEVNLYIKVKFSYSKVI